MNQRGAGHNICYHLVVETNAKACDERGVDFGTKKFKCPMTLFQQLYPQPIPNLRS